MTLVHQSEPVGLAKEDSASMSSFVGTDESKPTASGSSDMNIGIAFCRFRGSVFVESGAPEARQRRTRAGTGSR